MRHERWVVIIHPLDPSTGGQWPPTMRHGHWWWSYILWAPRLEVLTGCKVEASLKDAKAPMSFQFMRLGYFCADSRDSAPDHLVFNRTVTLKDSWAKKAK